MSRDEKVNWLQFAEERREYRKRIKKRKAENKKIKREMCTSFQETVPSVVGKKRCIVEREDLTLRLIMKPDFDLERTQTMETKGSVKGREKVYVSPNWDAVDIESSTTIIEKNKDFVV
jgi:hypothetical protein